MSEAGPPTPTSLLPLFEEYYNEVIAASIFKTWAPIACIAGALESRVWMETYTGRIYPNMFLLFLGRPASGKSTTISPVAKFWAATNILKVAPDTMTFASLIDVMKEYAQARVLQNVPLKYSALNVASQEFQALVPDYDMTMLTRMVRLYDGDVPDFQSSTRGGGVVKLDNPLLHMLLGTQPKTLSSILPDTAWQQGFMSRVLVVYSNETHQPSFDQLFNFDKKRRAKVRLEAQIIAGIKALCDMYGEITWEPEAGKAMSEWLGAGCPPRPKSPKLENYCGRRFLLLFKIVMVLCCSEFQYVITMDHFLRAQQLLFDAESVMQDAFLDMSQTSDTQVIKDVYEHVLHQTINGHPNGVTERMLRAYIGTKIPVPQVPGMLDHLVASGVLRKVSGFGNVTEASYSPGHLGE